MSFACARLSCLSLTFRLAGGLAGGLAAALTLPMAAQAQCVAPMASVLLERFIPADCAACWSAGAIAAGAPFVLDWIVPSPRGDEAALAPAAIAEATARVGAMLQPGTKERRVALPPLPGLVVEVEDGPGWSGYVGLQLRVRHEAGALPAGAVGYLALVENVAAGEESTPVERRLVRVLAGPLPLDGSRPVTEHLLALRVPQGANTGRLGAVGWVERAPGQVIALAPAPRGGCAAPA